MPCRHSLTWLENENEESAIVGDILASIGVQWKSFAAFLELQAAVDRAKATILTLCSQW
jgi:hypothetical protein